MNLGLCCYSLSLTFILLFWTVYMGECTDWVKLFFVDSALGLENIYLLLCFIKNLIIQSQILCIIAKKYA